MNTVSSGSGTPKGSPYISSFSSSKCSGRPAAIGWLREVSHSRSRSPASRHFRLQGVPISRLKGFEKCAECRKIAPMPDQTASAMRSTTASATWPCAAWPHQISTSVPARRSAVRPCSGSCRVAVVAAMPPAAFSAAAMVPCMVSGYSAATSAFFVSWMFSPQTVTRIVIAPPPVVSPASNPGPPRPTRPRGALRRRGWRGRARGPRTGARRPPASRRRRFEGALPPRPRGLPPASLEKQRRQGRRVLLHPFTNTRGGSGGRQPPGRSTGAQRPANRNPRRGRRKAKPCGETGQGSQPDQSGWSGPSGRRTGAPVRAEW